MWFRSSMCNTVPWPDGVKKKTMYLQLQGTDSIVCHEELEENLQRSTKKKKELPQKNFQVLPAHWQKRTSPLFACNLPWLSPLSSFSPHETGQLWTWCDLTCHWSRYHLKTCIKLKAGGEIHDWNAHYFDWITWWGHVLSW